MRFYVKDIKCSKVGKDESQRDKHKCFPETFAADDRFFWHQISKASPPQKKMQTHKLIVPCAEVWNQCPKVLIWDKDAVYWRFWWDLVIHGAPHFETHPRQCDQNKSLFASLMITYTYIFYMVVEQQDSNWVNSIEFCAKILANKSYTEVK